jgi:hypothetical protein
MHACGAVGVRCRCMGALHAERGAVRGAVGAHGADGPAVACVHACMRFDVYGGWEISAACGAAWAWRCGLYTIPHNHNNGGCGAPSHECCTSSLIADHTHRSIVEMTKSTSGMCLPNTLSSHLRYCGCKYQAVGGWRLHARGLGAVARHGCAGCMWLTAHGSDK